MKTWDDYKNHVFDVDPEIAKDIKETEEIAAIVSAMIEKRKSKGSSRRKNLQDSHGFDKGGAERELIVT